MWRWGLFALAACALVLGQLFAQGESGALDRVSTPAPPPIRGWLVIQQCSITGQLDNPFSEWAYLRPESITLVSNPVGTPAGCVTIAGSSGRRIFIRGTMAGVAAMLSERRLEQQQRGER